MPSKPATLRQEMGEQDVGGACCWPAAVFSKVLRERNEFQKELSALQVKMKGNREYTAIWDFVGLEKTTSFKGPKYKRGDFLKVAMTESSRTCKVKKVTKGTEHCGVRENVLHSHPASGELKRASTSVPVCLCLPATMLPRGGSQPLTDHGGPIPGGQQTSDGQCQ